MHENASSMASAPLDSRQLAAFAAVARRRSFTLAAKDLFLTQSAVSHALRALEEEVGARLLERSGRHVELTQAGEQFLRHVDKILQEMAEARAGLDALSRWGQGRLRVGASTTACQYLLPAVLREFRQSFPRCPILVEPGDHDRQLELLGQERVDLALTLDAGLGRELSAVPLFTDELRLLVWPQHPWARAGRVQRAEIGRETFILYRQSSYTFRVVNEYFRAEGVPLGATIELGSMEAIKELAKIGLGVGVLAPWVARAELESGALVEFPLGRRPLRRRWVVAHRRRRRLSLAEETFVGLCRTVAEAIAVAPAGAE
jgi:DNA-binding transcriptional LysR family regulator